MNRAHSYRRAIVAITLMVGVGGVALAQSLSPVQRTPEEEKQFREWQSRYFTTEAALNACMRKEVEGDYAIKYASVPTTVTRAINTCSALLETYAQASPGCASKSIEKYCVQTAREQLMETWVPVLLKRRVELQPDGPKYLYDFASRFVYAVVAKNEKAKTTTQGSAVAVDKRHLVTNCHVIDKATSITIRQGQTQIRAERSGLPVVDGADRCLLYADPLSDVQLPTFAAIREWSDLNVGERIFAIGIPQGFALDLSLTLSDGILSWKRTDGKHRLIQTTAPISQGSSGGGLFDSSGRLLGITTFTLPSGQNLNFAIAAEDWRYELCHANRTWFGPPPDCGRYRPAP